MIDERQTNIAIANTGRDFDWHIYIRPWFILKVKIIIMHILIVNIWQTLKDRADIIIAIK